MTSPIRPLPQNAGVSLVETLVALFVIALMSAAGAVMTSQSLRGARAVEMKGAAAAEISTALGTLSADLAAYSGRASQDPGLNSPASVFEGYGPRSDGRLLLFVRNGWDNPAGETRADLQRVEYRVEDGALVRRSWAAPDAGPGTRVVDRVLIAGLDRIEARYGRQDTWRDDWSVVGNDPGLAPQKMEIRLVFSQDDVLTARYLLGAGT